MKTISAAIQQNLELFVHKPRLSQVAPQIPHASPYKRGDHVFWVDWVEAYEERIFKRRNGEAGVKREKRLKPVERRGRILCCVPQREWGWYVQKEEGGRIILFDVEMKMRKRPSRSR